MKISRKMQQQVDLKIKHAMATGPLYFERPPSPAAHRRHEPGKPDPEASSQSK